MRGPRTKVCPWPICCGRLSGRPVYLSPLLRGLSGSRLSSGSRFRSATGAELSAGEMEPGGRGGDAVKRALEKGAQVFASKIGHPSAAWRTGRCRVAIASCMALASLPDAGRGPAAGGRIRNLANSAPRAAGAAHA